MKWLIFVVGIVAYANFANADCSEEDQKALNECYKIFTKAVDPKLPVVNKKFCSALHEHQDCLREKAKNCKSPSPENLTKIFATDIKNVLKIIYTEFSYKYVCNHEYTATEEDEKCVATLGPEDLDCGHPKDCKEMEEYVACFKKGITKKCKNEELSQVYADAALSGFKSIIPKCA